MLVAVLLAGAAGAFAPWASVPAGPDAAATGPGPALRPPDASSAAPVPARRIFNYEEVRPPAPAFRPAPVTAATPAPLIVRSEPPPPAVRVIGLVQRGGILKAALAVSGETLVLGPGESGGGYTVLAVDADRGVTVRMPDGQEVRLPAEGPETR